MSADDLRLNLMYLLLSSQSRLGWLGVLQEDVVKAAEQYQDYVHKEPESKALLRAEQLLRHAIIPGHNKFFDRVSRLPGGLKFLIDMRQDLLVIAHSTLQDMAHIYLD
jgi:malonyl-CoA decarboxylase